MAGMWEGEFFHQLFNIYFLWHEELMIQIWDDRFSAILWNEIEDL